MSRTLKDAPYKVRERRYGRRETSHTPNCGVTHSYTDRTSAVFYAHETRERESYEARLRELGYTVKTVEREGFLGSRFPDGAHHWQLMQLIPGSMRRNATVDLLNVSARTVVDHPQEYVVRIDLFTEEDADLHGTRFLPGRFITRRRLQHGRAKRNLFVEVKAELTTNHDGWCPHGEYELGPGDPHRGGAGHCCYWCSKAAKRQLKEQLLDRDMTAELLDARFSRRDDLLQASIGAEAEGDVP